MQRETNIWVADATEFAKYLTDVNAQVNSESNNNHWKWFLSEINNVIFFIPASTVFVCRSSQNNNNKKKKHDWKTKEIGLFPRQSIISWIPQ